VFAVFTPPENPLLPANDDPPAKRDDGESIEFERNPELAASEPLKEL
jgi:hypothetical protein